MNIISTCHMGPGTFEAKFVPISYLEEVENIYILRKEPGPSINKVRYIILPEICRYKLANILLTPLLLIFYAKKYKTKLILSYHVIPHAFFAYFASICTNIPFVISQTGLVIQKLSDKKIIGRIVLHIFRKALFINVPGSLSKKHWIHKGIESSKINILHSTIDIEVFKNRNTAKKKYDFIYVGNLGPEKNIELIINAFEDLVHDNYCPRLTIVGDGPERLKLESLVKEKKIGDNIEFVGFQKDISFWLNHSEIFVMSSVTDAMPTALMQAMACELICISSNVGNIPDLIVNDINGYLFESDNLGELIELMRFSFNNRNELSHIRTKARDAVVRGHAISSATHQWKTLIQDFKLT